MRMLRVGCAVVLAGFIAGCQSGAPAGAPEDDGRVVLVSYDGLGAGLLRQWLDDGVMTEADGFTALAEDGFAADALRPVNPTLTAVNHLSLATGRLPSATGIVSNSFRAHGSAVNVRSSGYSASSAVPTLWRLAARAGLRAGVLLWPGVDGGAIDRMADFGVMWPLVPLAQSALVTLDPEIAEALVELPSADDVPGLQWRLTVGLGDAEPGAVEMLIAAFDGTPNGVPRYDQAAVRRLDEVSWSFVGEREWFQTTLQAQSGEDLRPHLYGAWSKLLRVDRHRGELAIYRGSFWRLMAYPAEFQDGLEAAVGPWPGEPDAHLLEAWWLDAADGIDLDTYLEQIERFDRYIDGMAAHTVATEEFRLLMTYHPAVDEYLHSSMIVDPRQAAFSPGRALAAREGLKRTGRSADQSVATLWRLLDHQRDVLAVVSDHGQMPLHDVVRVNRVLADAGLVNVESSNGRSRVAATTPMAAASSGGCSNIYLNLAGREPGGVVSAGAEAAGLLRRAAQALTALEADGQPVVEKILNRAEAAAYGLDNPASGDLIVFLRPGFAASDQLDGEPLSPSTYYGQHGYLNSHDELNAIFFARGAGVRRRTPSELSVTDVAPMIAGWLGLAFPE